MFQRHDADKRTRLAAATHSFSDCAAALKRLYVEMWEAVADSVLDRRCAIGIFGSLSPAPPQFSAERLLTVRGINVVSPQHPLATQRAPIPTAVLAEHIQLMHADRSSVWRTARLGLLSERRWHLGDLAAMHHFLRAGVGFGMMPLHMVQADLTSGALVEIHVEDDPREGPAITMSAAYLTNKPPGRAGRWFIDRLKEEAAAPRVNGAAAVSADSISPIPRANRNPVLKQATVESSLGRAALTRLMSTGG